MVHLACTFEPQIQAAKVEMEIIWTPWGAHGISTQGELIERRIEEHVIYSLRTDRYPARYGPTVNRTCGGLYALVI